MKQIELINRLHATGFWGSTPREVVRRLIDRALEEQAKQFPPTKFPENSLAL